MKIGRFRTALGESHWGVIDPAAQTVRQILVPFATWAPLAAQGELPPLAPQAVSLEGLRLLAPLDPHARVFGVGMNYQTHLSKLGRAQTPPCTLGFIKPQSAIVGPDEEIVFPATTAKLDFEIELVAVVAREPGDDEAASACLLGYTIGNDTSARDAGEMLGLLDLFGQKALDASTPIGPWLVTLDELGGAGQPELDFTLTVNNELRQRDNTRNMIFPVDELLNFVDARVRLKPGDLIFTGTTSGVGKEDGRFLQPGDRVVAEIHGIGQLRNRIGAVRELAPARRAGRLGLPTR